MTRASCSFVIVGAGYVGLSLGVLLSRQFKVGIIDLNKDRVKKINEGESYLDEDLLQSDLKKYKKNIHASTEYNNLNKPEYFIISTPTNYDETTQEFDTKTVEDTARHITKEFPESYIVIKSTVPVGFTKSLKEKLKSDKIIFSPEFLREGSSLTDNLYPSRIIVSNNSKGSEKYLNIIKNLSKINDVKTLLMDETEAESVKLFSNTYLAMRVAFFNELDSYALNKNLSSLEIINGVCEDKRIGHGYNNPSFGYGGYCLPKDTKQLLSNYSDIPQSTISAIVEANSKRKDLIANEIIKLNPKKVGIYRLVMKEGSDNIRHSAVQGIVKRLRAKNIDMIIYEPVYEENEFFGTKVMKDLDDFLRESDLIIANRLSKELIKFRDKVYTRDLFKEN